MYSSALMTNSTTYSRTCAKSNYYYEAIQLTVVEVGNYSFRSNSNFDTYGYIYKSNFNPLNPFENLLSKNDDGCRDGQFKLISYLQTGTTYILVVTTFSSNVTGDFQISVSGPQHVSLNHISEYFAILCILIKEADNTRNICKLS